MTKTSAFLTDLEDEAVFVAIESDADEFLSITTGSSLMPQASLATLIDAVTGFQRLCNAFLAAPHKAESDVALVDNGCGVEACFPVRNGSGHHQFHRRDQALVLFPGRIEGERCGWHNKGVARVFVEQFALFALACDGDKDGLVMAGRIVSQLF